MSKNKMNVILTGGTGILGSQIIFELLKKQNITFEVLGQYFS